MDSECKVYIRLQKTLQGIIYRTLQCFLCFLSRFMILTGTNICSIIRLKKKECLFGEDYGNQ